MLNLIRDQSATIATLFSICHWNLNCSSAHSYAKVLLLKVYIDSSTYSDDSNLEISGCTLVRPDHPSNNKRGGVCIYYKNILCLRILNF